MDAGLDYFAHGSGSGPGSKAAPLRAARRPGEMKLVY